MQSALLPRSGWMFRVTCPEASPRHGIAILAGRAIVTGKPINYLYLSFFLESLA
jgi:hypothetical protein